MSAPTYFPKLRVFWHELGHFIAQRYNQQFYGGGGTAHVRIKRALQANQSTEYVGETILKDYDKSAVLRCPAALIASYAYGCFFQCVQYGSDFSACFSSQGGNVHGSDDFERVNQLILESTGNLSARGCVMRMLEAHFQRIKDCTEFRELREIKVHDLIGSDAEEFDVPLDELHRRFNFLYELHRASYQTLVNELKSIIFSQCFLKISVLIFY